MKKRYLIVPLVALCITSNVYAITSNEVTYDNDGTTENLTTTLDTLNSELKKYKTGGSVQSNQMLEGATGYSKGVLVTGTIKSKAAQTYTPGTSNQTIAAGQYLSGDQTIQGDANLTAGNIAKGKSIFGVSGTYTSDANATAGNILKDKTAYVNGSKVTGTIGSVAAKTYTPGTSNQTIASGQYLSGTQTIAGDADLKATNILNGVNIFGVKGTAPKVTTFTVYLDPRNHEFNYNNHKSAFSFSVSIASKYANYKNITRNNLFIDISGLTLILYSTCALDYLGTTSQVTLTYTPSTGNITWTGFYGTVSGCSYGVDVSPYELIPVRVAVVE